MDAYTAPKEKDESPSPSQPATPSQPPQPPPPLTTRPSIASHPIVSPPKAGCTSGPQQSPCSCNLQGRVAC